MDRGICTFQVGVPFSTSRRMHLILTWGFTPQFPSSPSTENASSSIATRLSGTVQHTLQPIPVTVNSIVSRRPTSLEIPYEAVNDDAGATEQTSWETPISHSSVKIRASGSSMTNARPSHNPTRRDAPLRCRQFVCPWIHGSAPLKPACAPSESTSASRHRSDCPIAPCITFCSLGLGLVTLLGSYTLAPKVKNLRT